MIRKKTNPFPGLRPFDRDDTHLFFGRDKQIIQLVERLQRTRFLAIVGSSGCGKSSLIRAGLLPSFQAQARSPLLREGVSVDNHTKKILQANIDWRMAVMRPGKSPVDELGKALSVRGVIDDHWQSNQRDIYTNIIRTSLSRSSLGLVETIKEAHLPDETRVLILVDQFEEIFRYQNETKELSASDEAKAFVGLLINACHNSSVPIYCIITMRSDYLGNCMALPGLPEAISESQYLVPRLTRNELRSSITGPIVTSGEGIAPRLVARLLNQLGDNQDQLPLLQHALMRLWDKWTMKNQGSGPLDINLLNEKDSIQSGLGNHADEIFSNLTPQEKKVAKKIFKILTEKNAEGKEIRRPLSLQQLCRITTHTEEEIISVVEKYRAPKCCLLMPPVGTPILTETIIDISHESLMRTWPRLKQWIKEEDEAARHYQRIEDAALQWGKGAGGLWESTDSPQLMLALEWKDKHVPNHNWAALYSTKETNKNDKSNFDTVEKFLKESKGARAKQRNRARLIKIGLPSLATVSAFLTIFLIFYTNLTNKKNEISKLSAIMQNSDPLTQALFILEQPSDDYGKFSDYTNFTRKVAAQFVPKKVFQISENEGISGITIDDSGSKIAISTMGGTIYLWNWQTSGLKDPKPYKSGEPIAGLVFTSNGKGLLSGSNDGTIQYISIDPIDPKPHAIYKKKNTSDSSYLRAFAYHPNDNKIFLGLYHGRKSGSIRSILFSSENPPKEIIEDSLITELKSPPLSLSVDQSNIIIGLMDGSLKEVTHKGETVNSMTIPARNGPNPHLSFARHKSNNWMWAIGTEDGLLHILATNEQAESANACFRYNISNQETDSLYSFSPAGYSHITLKPEKSFGNVVGVGFMGDMPYGGYADGTVRIWQCDEALEEYVIVTSLTGHRSSIEDVVIDEKHGFLVSTDQREVRVWDLNQQESDLKSTLDIKLDDFDIIPNKQLGEIVTVDEDGKIFVFDKNINNPSVSSAAFNDLDTQLVTGHVDGSIILWNGPKFEESEPRSIVVNQSKKGDLNGINSLAFLRNDRIVSASESGSICIWRTDNSPPAKVCNDQIKAYDTGASSVDVFYDDQEEMIVSGGKDGVIWLMLTNDKSQSPIMIGQMKSPISKVQFNNTGDFIISLGDDGSLQRWPLRTKDIVKRLQERTEVCLNVSDRIKYLFEQQGVAEDNYNECLKK